MMNHSTPLMAKACQETIKGSFAISSSLKAKAPAAELLGAKAL
jgi:hypothetical protein